ncbi:MAG: hypothetical protein ABSF65_10540 [Candidatus Bathyarchaeia archaeon]|jgi:hypothetical protein
MATKDEPQSKKKRRTVLTLAVIALIIVLAVLTFIILYFPHNQTSTPTAANVEPIAPQYLPYEGNASRIFVVSATPSYGSYPGPTVPQTDGTPGIKKGAPCFIINVTVRNDYSAENPLPDHNIFNFSNPMASAFLTAKIFNNQDQISATDVTPPYPPVPIPGALVYDLASGKSTTVTIYLATNHQDINRFEIILEYVGSVPPP